MVPELRDRKRKANARKKRTETNLIYGGSPKNILAKLLDLTTLEYIYSVSVQEKLSI